MKLCKRHKAKKSKPVKKPKQVNKNPLWAKFSKWVQKIEQRQENDRPQVFVSDNDTHVCKHCGTEFTGGYCPKCSMPARWQRFNWRLLLLNFMDIWGLGNRPMFRTIRDLFWRPGYMIKDYLHGHHLSYFPPFKMLAVLTVILIFFMMLINQFTGAAPDPIIHGEEVKNAFQANEHFSNWHPSSTLSALWEQIERLLNYLDEHILYRILLQNILVVIAVKWAFSKVSSLNYVETFISQIYINCQFLIIAIVTMMFTWRIPDTNNMVPYMLEFGSITVPLVLTYDFHQLYGVSWKQALWKTIVATINLFILYFIIALIIGGLIALIEHFSDAGPILPQINHHVHVGLEPY